MSEHTLTISAVEDGWAQWKLNCHHDPEADKWQHRTEQGEIEQDCLGTCWMQTAFNDMDGNECIQLGAVTTYPIPIRPDDGWGWEESGSFVFDAAREGGKQ